jgi:RNA polymerase sigma-70 factor, ECF subfamily
LSDVADWQLSAERARPSDLPGFEDGMAPVDLPAALPDERREAFILTQVVGLRIRRPLR